MTNVVSLDEKKEFIRWVLKGFQMKRREVIWILNYMITNDELLQSTHFVEDAHYCPKAIVLSTTNSVGGVPFRFYHGSIMTADAEKTFHEIRTKPNEDLYIQVNFTSQTAPLPYFNVLEENQYKPKYLKDETVEKEANFIIEESLRQFQENMLLKKIDLALDTKNKKAFLALTSKMKNE